MDSANIIKSVNKASLYFIIPMNHLIKIEEYKKDSKFLNLIDKVQKDEFSQRVCENIDRRLLYEGKACYMKYTVDSNIYVTNYNTYSSSIIYINIVIDGQDICIEDFANLIAGCNILEQFYIDHIKVRDYLTGKGIKAGNNIFLLNQIVETDPPIPKEYDPGFNFIQENKSVFHQLLMRSDTCHKHLRPDNYNENFESISNFYGTIDLCSAVTLIQIYQYHIESIADKTVKIDLDHRACWWLTVTDAIFIQRAILSNVLDSINSIQNSRGNNIIKKTKDIEKALLEMQNFWYFEDMVYELSKKVVNKIKARVGTDRMLDNVQSRLETIENSALREINEEQTVQSNILNVILLVIACLQVIPLVYNIMCFIYDPSQRITMSQAIVLMQTIGIGILTPILVWKARVLGRIAHSLGSLIVKSKGKGKKDNIWILKD